MKPAIAIIGAGPGMGMAIARRFGREGFHIILLARQPEHLAALKTELEQQNITCETLAVDVSEGTKLKVLLAGLSQGHYLSVMVYNAMSMEPMGKPTTLEADALSKALQVSALSALSASQAVLPKMRERGNGALLFTGGGFALEPMAPMSALGIGKAALRNLAYSLFQELRPEGIHAATVTICGMVKAGTAFDPDVIAEHYWQLYVQKPADYERERIVR